MNARPSPRDSGLTAANGPPEPIVRLPAIVAVRLGRGLLLATLIVLAGCASRTGGYYKDDGPGSHIPANIDAIPDAVPHVELHAAANLRPYSVFGVRYTPIAEDQSYREEGVASWYGRKFHGEKTANGETYDMYAMTAAHPTLPIPSYARVTRVATGRSIIVRINDRGPFHSSRIIDLSYVAAAKLGLIGPGSGRVVVQAITNADILAGRYPAPPTVATTASPAAAPARTSAVADQVPVSAQTPEPELAQTLALFRQPAAPVRQMAAAGPEPPGAGGIYLQFGAFSSAENANALARRINTQAATLPEPVSVVYQAPLYKVRLGPYVSRSQATHSAASLADAAGLNPVIALDQEL